MIVLQRNQFSRTIGPVPTTQALIRTIQSKPSWRTTRTNCLWLQRTRSSTDRATALSNIFANVSLATATTGSTQHWSFNWGDGHLYSCNTATLFMRVVGLTGDEANLDYDAAGVNYVVRFNFHHNAPVAASASQTTSLSTGI